MNTLDDLRRLLDADAGGAPGPEGVVAAAEKGAARIRRRRRVVAVAGAAVLVAVVAMVVPAVAERRHADRPPPVSTPAERATGQVTLGVDAASSYVLTDQDVDANGQRILFGIPQADPRKVRRLAGALALDPDAGFDPAGLLRGERTTVSGHEAWYVADYPLGGYVPRNLTTLQRTALPTAVLGWRDPGGTWVLVHQEDREDPGRAKLFEAARAVRIHPAAALTLPVSLGRLPDGLPVSTVHSNRRTSARVTLGAEPAPLDTKWSVGPGLRTGVTIAVEPGTDPGRTATPVARIAGLEAWYSRTTHGTARGNGTLTVRAGGCLVTFSAWDAAQASAAQLREIAEAATYADCTDPTTWGPVVRR